MLSASVYAGHDARHMAAPPEQPPAGRVFVEDGEIRRGDHAWDGTEELWMSAGDLAGADVARFVRVCRAAPSAAPDAKLAGHLPRRPSAPQLPTMPPRMFQRPRKGRTGNAGRSMPQLSRQPHP